MVVLVGALAPIALVAVADYRADDGPRASAPDWSSSVERAVRSWWR